MMKNKLILFGKYCSLFLAGFILITGSGFCENIEERFGGSNNIVYDIFYNGIYTGKITWRYIGKEKVDGKETEVIFLDSKTSILKLLNLASKEKVFLDLATHLPLRAERDVVFFGKPEKIVEIYDQQKGCVKIISNKPKAKEKETYLCKDKPVHNILALLYFFPQDLALVKDKNLYFNLPTQKVIVKLVSEGNMSIGKEKKEALLLSGKGGYRFNLWLNKKERSPLKMEFLSLAGKVTVIRKNN